MSRITRKLEWDSGHRVLHHEGHCKYLHGHRYVAEITVEGGLDELGRVIDFGVVKQVMKEWIDKHWDHNLLLNSEDPLVNMIVTDVELAEAVGRAPFIFKKRNPTAEVMAEQLFTKATLLLPAHITVIKVKLWETPNCFAEHVL